MSAMDVLLWPPAGSPASQGAGAWRTRRFGSVPGDLDLKLDGSRPEAVTRVLAACLLSPQGEPWETAALWEANVQWRLQGLLAVARATRGPALEAEGMCQREGCGQSLEFDLDLDAFAEMPAPPRLAWENMGASLRLPTGNDQRRWAEAGSWDDRAMASALLEPEGGPAGPDEAWVEEAARRLEAADPLNALRVEATCPACGEASVLEVDLEGMLLASLAREQKDLIRQVFALAGCLHWSEAAILALPPERRKHYLKLAEG